MKKVDKNKENNQYYTLITGATGGLGKAFCFEIAKEGKNLFLTGTSDKKLERLKEDLLDKYPDLNIKYKECDLSNFDSRVQLIDALKNNNVKINLLINNAGFITEGSIKHSDINTILKCIQVNCEGTIHITKSILDLKEKDDKLDIINVTSMAGNYPMPYMAIYSATKALLNNFMTSLRYEYKDDNVNVLNVEPGGIETTQEMIDAINAQGLKGRLTVTPAEKIAKQSLKLSKKNKKTYVPGFFNNFTLFVSNLAPTDVKTGMVGKMWRKSQDKRNIK